MNLNVALAQAPSDLGDVAANWRRAQNFIERAAEQQAKLIVFPELYLQGYLANEAFLETAVTVPGPFLEELSRAAVQHDIAIAMGLARTDGAFPHLVYNSCLLAQPDGTHFVYDKIQLGTYGKYREGCFFAPGRRLEPVTMEFGITGIEICSDIMYPEIARVLALRGSVLHLVLSAGPDEFKDTWPCLLKVRSLENAFFTVYVNTVGLQRDTTFFGGSRVVDPSGNTIAESPFHEEHLLLAEIDLELVARKRRQRLLYRDRVPELYRPLTQETLV